MAKKNTAKTNQNRTDGAPSKRELQRQMQRTRDSLAETVGEIRETVQQEVKAVKKTVAGVLDYRTEFQKEPIVWSLGALSAGFALGYTVGYAHKNTKGSRQAPVLAFADSVVDELSTMGHGLLMPALDAKIRELFGFDFSKTLEQIRGARKTPSRKRPKRQIKSKPTSAKRMSKATPPKRVSKAKARSKRKA